MKSNLFIVSLDSSGELIRFILEEWRPCDQKEIIKALLDDPGYEDYDGGWKVVVGRCCICDYEQTTIIPDDVDVFGLECDECENMSIYPEELEEKECLKGS